MTSGTLGRWRCWRTARAGPAARNRGRGSAGSTPLSPVAYAAAAAITGTVPSVMHVRRVMPSIRLPPFDVNSMRQGRLSPSVVCQCSVRNSRLSEVVTMLGDLVEHHHLMVLVDGVVTVDGIAADHVTEADEDLDLLVGEDHDVLAAKLDLPRQGRHAVAADDAELLEVDVDRVRPPPGVVLDDPPLELVHLRHEAELRAVHEPAVDLPSAVAALEAEPPGDPRLGRGDVRQPDRVEDRVAQHGLDARGGDRLGIEAPVLLDGAELELEQLVALSRSEDLAGRPAAVDLLEPVLQMDALRAEAVGDLLEVDDDVGALRDAHRVARHLDRPGQEVAVDGEHPERDLLVGLVGVGQEELVQARRPRVEQAQAVAALLDLVRRLRAAVDQEDVSRMPSVLNKSNASWPVFGSNSRSPKTSGMSNSG